MSMRTKDGTTFWTRWRTPVLRKVSPLPPLSLGVKVHHLLPEPWGMTQAGNSLCSQPTFNKLRNVDCVWRLHEFSCFSALWPVIKPFSQIPVFFLHWHNNFEMYYCWETVLSLPTSPWRDSSSRRKEVFTIISWEKVACPLDLIKFSKTWATADTQSRTLCVHAFIFFFFSFPLERNGTNLCFFFHSKA